MRRLSPFDRDFQDLHGRRPAGFIRHEDIRRGRLVTRVDHAGARLVIGALGVFWSIVLIAVVGAMLYVGGVFVVALFQGS